MTPYLIFDGDNHLYEPRDCFTRYLDRRYHEETIHVVRDAAGDEAVFAGAKKVQLDGSFFDEVVRPGSLKELLKKMKAGETGSGAYERMPMDPAFQQRDPRLRRLDEQGVQAAVLYPSLGLMADHYLADVDVLYASLLSFNRWLFEEWGFVYENRLIVPALMSMRDVDRSVELLDWVIDHGARMVLLPPGPAYGRSPGDPCFDRFWARIDEAGLVVAYHIDEPTAGYKERRSVEWGQDPEPSFYTQSAWQWTWAYGEVPIQETLSALVFDNVFARFPNLMVLSSENGCEWVPSLLRRMDKMRGMARNGPWIGGQLSERPSAIFKRHVRVVPYFEDDVAWVAGQVGPDVLVSGSDYPHAEGIANPSQMVEHLRGFPEDVQRKIMRDNGMSLLGLD